MFGVSGARLQGQVAGLCVRMGALETENVLLRKSNSSLNSRLEALERDCRVATNLPEHVNELIKKVDTLTEGFATVVAQVKALEKNRANGQWYAGELNRIGVAYSQGPSMSANDVVNAGMTNYVAPEQAAKASEFWSEALLQKQRDESKLIVQGFVENRYAEHVRKSIEIDAALLELANVVAAKLKNSGSSLTVEEILEAALHGE